MECCKSPTASGMNPGISPFSSFPSLALQGGAFPGAGSPVLAPYPSDGSGLSPLAQANQGFYGGGNSQQIYALLAMLTQLLQQLAPQAGAAGIGGRGQAFGGNKGGNDNVNPVSKGKNTTTNSGPTGPLSKNTAVPSKNGFAEALLKKIGAPVTPENLKFLDAWQKAEGGSADNPFNTTQDAPGATRFNSVGVKRYPSVEVGLDATVKTLNNGRYGPILAALRQGSSAQEAARALAASPWGTGALVQKILA